MRTHFVATRLCVAGFLGIAALGACRESTAPATLAPPEGPNRVMQYVDHFSCSNVTGEDTWYCDYTGTTSWDDDPFGWAGDGGIIPASPVNCQTDATSCRGAGGSYVYYDPSLRADESQCDPLVDPKCEQTLPDSMKTKIRAALTTQLKIFSTIADTAVRARCQEMLDKFNQMFDNTSQPGVFIGGSDTNQPDSLVHYGAWSRFTQHIHFDPWALNNLTAGSDKGWQVANTALHEAAHALGHEHTYPLMLKYRGRTPVYDSREIYFSDLNPGSAGCMKP